MNDEEYLKISRPFGPSLGIVNIPEELINKINSIDISNLTKPNLSHSKKKFKAFIKSVLRITDKL